MDDKQDNTMILVRPDNLTASVNYLQRITDERYQGPMLFSSFAIVTNEDKAKLFNVTGGQSHPISELDGTPVAVENYVFERGVFRSEEDDEARSVCRLWLISPSGERFYSAASSIVSELVRMVTMFGPAPWQPPLKLVFHVGKTKRGRKWWHTEVLLSSWGDTPEQPQGNVVMDGDNN